MGQHIRAGDIVFIKGQSIISRMIKWFDKGEFSHVVIATSATTCITAEYNTRVKEIAFEYEDYEVVDLGLTEAERIRLTLMARGEIGKRYDYGQIFYLLLKRFFNMTGSNRFNSPNNYICSELVNYLLVRLYKIPPGTDLTDCTPNQLYWYLTAQFPQIYNPLRPLKSNSFKKS